MKIRYEPNPDDLPPILTLADQASRCLFSPDGAKIASASTALKCLRLWDATAGTEVARFGEGTSGIATFAFPTDKSIVAVMFDGVIVQWDITSRTDRALGTIIPEPLQKVKFRCGTYELPCVAISPDGVRVAAVLRPPPHQSVVYDDQGCNQYRPGQLLHVIDVPAQTSSIVASEDRRWGSIHACAVSADLPHISLACDEGLRVFDPGTSREEWLVQEHLADQLYPTSGQRFCEFFPGGERVLVAGADGIEIWDVKKRKQVTSLAAPGPKGWIVTAGISPDGMEVAFADWQGTRLHLANVLNHNKWVVGDMYGHLVDCSFSPAGSRVVTTSDSGVKVYDCRKRVSHGRSSAAGPAEHRRSQRYRNAQLCAHAREPMAGLLYHKEERTATRVVTYDLVLGVRDGVPAVLEARSSTGEYEKSVRHLATADDFDWAISHDQTRLASKRRPTPEELQVAFPWERALASRRSLDWSLAAGGHTRFGPIHLWDTQARKGLAELIPEISGPGAVWFSPDATLVAVYCSGRDENPRRSRQSVLRIHDAVSGNQVYERGFGTYEPVACDWSKDSRRLAWTSQRSLKMVDPYSGEEECIWEPGESDRRSVRRVRSCVFSPDGVSLACVVEPRKWRSGDTPRTELLIWNAANGDTQRLPCDVFRWSFTPSGRLILATEPGEDLRLWDVKKREPQCTMCADGVKSYRFSPDESRMAVTTSASSLRLFDTANGDKVQLGLEAADISAYTFSPDGAYLAGVSRPGHLVVWSARDGAVASSYVGPWSGIDSLSWLPCSSEILLESRKFRFAELVEVTEIATPVPVAVPVRTWLFGAGGQAGQLDDRLTAECFVCAGRFVVHDENLGSTVPCPHCDSKLDVQGSGRGMRLGRRT